MVYSLLGPLGTELSYFDGRYARSCALGTNGFNCIMLAGDKFYLGGFANGESLRNELVTRGIDLMKRHCFQGGDSFIDAYECNELGNIYDENSLQMRGVSRSFPVDPQKAVAAYERACDLDTAFGGCHEAGQIYLNGARGFAVNLAKARLLFSKGCSSDHKEPIACDALMGMDKANAQPPGNSSPQGND